LIDSITARTQTALEQFEAVVQGVQTVAAKEDGIRDSMEQQSQGSEQIRQAVTALTELTDQVNDSAESMLNESETVLSNSRKSQESASTIASSVESVSKEAYHINALMTHAVEMSELNKVNISTLIEASRVYNTGPDVVYRWDSSLNTGNDLIDSEHRQLIQAINSFLAAANSPSDAKRLRDTLDFLNDYTQKHFSDEEALQKKYNYPNYTTHHQFHEWYKKEVATMTNAFLREGSSRALIERAHKQVGDTIIAHIKSEDVRLAQYIKKQGLQL
jgi:hemerythrin-like metal-binding protein